MLPSLAAEPPASDHWLHEIKHDGYRAILLVDGGNAQAFTRNAEWLDRPVSRHRSRGEKLR
jgi:bifunctional non-homologous end joining protein LigD